MWEIERFSCFTLYHWLLTVAELLWRRVDKLKWLLHFLSIIIDALHNLIVVLVEIVAGIRVMWRVLLDPG